MHSLLFASVLALAAPSSSAAPPAWAPAELSQLLQQVSAAAQLPPEQVNAALIQVARAAYRQRPVEGSIPEQAEAAVKARDPSHPKVPKEQWILALSRLLYGDLGARASALSRIEADRDRRRFFGQAGAQFSAASSALEGRIQWMIEGLEDAVAPLPRASGPRLKPPSHRGELVRVEGGKVIVQRLSRVQFVDGKLPPGRRRTGSGADRELYAALKQANTHNKMFTRVSPDFKRKLGHLQLILPASSPARVLNEILRAARPAGFRRAHLLVMNERGALSELRFRFGRRDKGAPRFCADSMPMSRCAAALAAAPAGPLLYRRPD